MMTCGTNRLRLALAAAAALLLAVLPFPTSGAPLHAPNQPHDISDCRRGGWRNYPHAGFRNQADCVRFVTTGVFVCRDPLGCVSYEEGDPLRIATALAISGVDAPLGVDSQRGVEIALTQHGDLFGHALALNAEDDTCSDVGGEAAANAIVADPTVAAVVGTSCSSAARAAAPIISDAGYSMVSPSNTRPDLTDPASHEPGYLRVSWNDRDQAVAMATFLGDQGAATTAVIADGSQYSLWMADAFIRAFQGDTLAYVADPGGNDAAQVIAEVVSAPIPDVLYLPVFETPGLALVTEARAAQQLNETLLASSDALGYQGFVDRAGEAAEGMLFTGPDTSFMDTRAYRHFARAYFREYHERPLTVFSPFAFDATNVILRAIEAVAIVDRHDTLYIGRQALRDALFATRGFEGLTGTITCNRLGDCATVGFAILTVLDGEIVPVP